MCILSWTIQSKITLDSIQQMNKEQLFFYKRGLATQMFCIYIAHFPTLVHSERIQKRDGKKNWIWAISLTMSISAKMTGPLGNTACYFKREEAEVPHCVFLLLWNFSLQQHNDTVINSSTGHNDTAGNQKKKKNNNTLPLRTFPCWECKRKKYGAKHLRSMSDNHIKMCHDHNGGVKGHFTNRKYFVIHPCNVKYIWSFYTMKHVVRHSRLIHMPKYFQESGV